MADQAGIELVLSAPDVRSIMDDVIDAWKELNKQEKEAAEQLAKYNADSKEVLAQQKEYALSSQKIKDIFKEIAVLQKEQADAAELAAITQKKGILGAITGYFQQKKELKDLVIQIKNTTSELYSLEKRQESIFKLVHRGNAAAKREYTENEQKIKSITATLGNMNDKLKLQEAIVKSNSAKFDGIFKGFRTGFNILKTSAAVAFTGVLAGLALLAAGFAAVRRIYERTFQNDFVDNELKKSTASFKKAREDFADAFAPIGVAVANVLGNVASGLSKFISDNSHEIFVWAAKVGGTIAGVAASIGTQFERIAVFFELQTERVKKALIILQAVQTGGLSLLEQSGELEVRDAKINILKDEAFRLELLAKAQYENAKRKQTAALLEIESQVKINNLTKEQLDLIKKLRAEYEKITGDVRKQIEALNIQEAGPIAGILLKAELAAKALEKQSEEYVELAKKLGKAQSEINNVTASFDRLISAARTQAQTEAINKLTEALRALESQVEDNAAKQAGTNDELALKRRLDLLGKERIELQLNAEKLRALGDEYQVNKVLYESIIQSTFDAIAQLESDALETFNNNRTVEAADKRVKSIKEQLELIKKAQAEIAREINEVPNISDDRKVFLQVEFETQQASLDTLSKELDDLENRASEGLVFPVQLDFAETKKEFDEFQKSLFFTVDIPTGKQRKKDRKFSTPDDAPGENQITGDEALRAFVETQQLAFDTVTGIAVNSVDLQIEANDRLIESRQNVVDALQEQVDREAQYKALGLANDYDILKARLEGEIKLRDEAQKKAEILAEKRIKAQQRADTASQVSSLITAVANIFARSTAEAGPLGVPLAIAAAAAMFIGFAASKLQASKLVTAYKGSKRVGETFGQMAPGEGYDDSPGMERGLMVVDSKGRLRGALGGDEYLNKQSVSKKHRAALDYLNENEVKFNNVNLLAMLKAMDSSPIKPVFDIPDFSTVQHFDMSKVVAKNQKLRDRMIVVNTKSGVDEEAIERAVEKAMKKHADTMITYHESRPDRVPNEWLKDYTEFTSKTSKKKKTA